MKKILTLVMALALILSMGAFTAMAEDAENINYVSFPMMAPNGPVAVPANSTVYYSFSSQVFDGWTVSIMGASAVTLDGAECSPNMFGAYEVALKATSLNDIVLGIVNNDAEDITVMVSVSQPVGTMDSPFELMDGENIVAIEEGTMEYHTFYMPTNNGDLTVTISGIPADVVVDALLSTMEADVPFAADEEGNLVAVAAVESYAENRVILKTYGAPAELTVNVELELPPVGSELNPIKIGSLVELTGSDTLPAGEEMHFTIINPMDFLGQTIKVEADEGIVITVNGEEYTPDENGEITMPTGDDIWSLKLVVKNTGDADADFTFLSIPEIKDGDVAVELPEESLGYYAYYIPAADGTLTLTFKDATAAFDALLINAATGDMLVLSESETADTLTMDVTAGDIMVIAVAAEMDEETWATPALNVTMTVAGPVVEEESSEPESSEPESSEPEASEPEASEPEASEPESSETEKNPETGVASGVGVAMALVAVAGAVMALESKKRA